MPDGQLPEAAIDLLLLAGLLLVATAVRLPYLQLVPIITDEAFEVLSALPILDGQLPVFGPINPTFGPLMTYMLAAGFWLFGTSTELPRLLFLLLGVLTVGTTYWLGRSMGGRLAGLLGAALLAFCPVHVLVNSHVAWSNSASPLLATLAFAALHSALRRRSPLTPSLGAGSPGSAEDEGSRPSPGALGRGWLLVLGGLSYSLALQTHVSLFVVAPGLVAWFLARRDNGVWLRQPWPYLAAGAALLAYGNMLAYHLFSGGAAIADFQQHDYAWVSDPTLSVYWDNVRAMIQAVGQNLGGQVPRIQVPGGSLVTLLLLAWYLAAMLWALRSGEWMPLLVTLSAVLILPYFNQSYKDLFHQRYTAFLLPLSFAAMGLAAARALEWWGRLAWPAARARLSLGLFAFLLLAACPLRATLAHYDVETAAGRDNRPMMAMVAYIKDSLPAGTPLYLSPNLQIERADGGFRYLRAVYYYLTLKGVEHWVLDLPDMASRLDSGGPNGAWLLLRPGDVEELSQQFTLQAIEDAPRVPNGSLLVRSLP
jgi:4-amino-4-deoxy-L-arabinose transferase-like glycosyltransferase